MNFLNFLARALAFHLLLVPVITLLGAMVLLTLAKLKRTPAALRAGISGATLIVILILPWAVMTVPKVTIPVFPGLPDAQTESLNRHLPPPGVLTPPTDLSETLASSSNPLSSVETSKVSPATKSSRYGLNWYALTGLLISALILVWLLGMVWRLGALVLGMVGIIRLRWSSHLVTDNRLLGALHDSCKRLDYRGSVLFLISSQIAIPITWGWLRAKIALPLDAVNWPAERIDAALLHELAHIKRRDFAIQTLNRITCTVHWYNPLVLRLFSVWKTEAEQACDDLVLRSGYSGEKYSDILLEVWRSATISRPQSSLGLAMVRSSTLEQRVIAILDHEREREEVSPRKQLQIFAIFGGITVLIAVIGLTRSTNYHLTPELQNDMQAILQQVQMQESAHLSLQLQLERKQEYWSNAKGAFTPQPQATAANITLELNGTKAQYRASYHPLVSPWVQGPAPYYIDNRTDVSDGNQTETILSHHRLGSESRMKWRTNGDIGLLAGFTFRADDQVRTVVEGLEGNGLMPFNGSSYGIERTIIRGAPAVRVQDIITLGAAQRRTWWFDPARDYALIQYEMADFNNGSSQPSYSEVTSVEQLQKVADGVWYPTQFSTQSFRYVDGQLTDDSYRSTTKITSLAALPAIDPALFQFAATATTENSPANSPAPNSKSQGKVLNADGNPVANATISLVSAGRLMTITDGQIDSGTESILSASDGGFTLNQPGVAGDLLVAVNEGGYAVIPWEKFSGTITLTAWASVSGTVLGDSMPAAQKSVEFQNSIPLNPRSSTEGQVRLLSRVAVDSQGSFLASHVPVGIVNAMLAAGPLSDQHSLLDQHSLMETIHIETQPDQTARADFGGKGITVTGKAEMPNDPDLDLNWGQILWARSPVGLNIPSGMPQDQADKLTREYYASDAGKKALLATRVQYFHIQADGSFEIENVSPGSYELRIDFIHKPAQGGRIWSVGNTSAQVEVKAGDSSVEVPLLKLHLLPKSPNSSTSNDARNPSLPASLQMEGEKLTIDQIAALEQKVASDPSDLQDRVRILGYYFLKRISQSSAQNAAQPHLLWIIHNLPASTIAGDPIAGVDYRTDLPHYEEASAAWKEALAKYPNDPKVIGNAAAFYLLNEPERAEKLLLQGQKLEPNNTGWDMRLGQLYTLRSMGPDLSVKTASKAKALKWFEQGLSSLQGINRFYGLEAPAKAAFEAGDFTTAHQYAQELLQMAPQYPKGLELRERHLHRQFDLGPDCAGTGRHTFRKELSGSRRGFTRIAAT